MNHLEPFEEGNPYGWRICGAKLSEKNEAEKGHPFCQNRAGHGTDHVGEGRCKFHGGSSLKGLDRPNFKHGKYMTTRTDKMRETFKQKAQALEAKEDTLELIGELELQRHLLYLFLVRQSKFHDLELPTFIDMSEQELASMLGQTTNNPGKEVPLTEMIQTVYQMVDAIVKTSATISNQRKETVLTITEVKYLQNILRETFERFIPDVDTREEAIKFFAERVGG